MLTCPKTKTVMTNSERYKCILYCLWNRNCLLYTDIQLQIISRVRKYKKPLFLEC